MLMSIGLGFSTYEGEFLKSGCGLQSDELRESFFYDEFQ